MYLGWGAVACSVLLLLAFLIQLYYYLFRYSRIIKFRNNRGVHSDEQTPPISIIVVARQNTYYFIENYLPLLLSQDYDRFEVVVVDCSYDDTISSILSDMCAEYNNLHLTRINRQSNVEHSMKLAITVGIKATHYEHMIMTTADSYPTSNKWLSLMAKGFISGDIVIGYCGVESRNGFVNRMMRCGRMTTSIRYLAEAIRGNTYRGISHNLGYTKSLYFDNKGFNYLNMNIGDDDLFVQKIVKNSSVSVVMNPNATMRQIQSGNWSWWHSITKFYSFTFRYYPSKIKAVIITELFSRFVFYATVLALACILPLWWNMIPIVLMILRLVVVYFKMWRIALRLGERKLMRVYFIHDICSPIGELCLMLSRRLRPNSAVWR